MARARKTFREKLAAAKAKPGLPKVFYCEKSEQRLVVPSPAEIEDLLRKVPEGRVVTLRQIGQRISDAHGADLACPMTTGIFASLIANAAEEEPAGSKPLPWWRLLKTGGELNSKYPGGGQTQKRRLEAEGHRIVARGKKLVLADYEAARAKLS